MNDCVRESQSERVVVTRNGTPVAVVVGVEGLDEEQVWLGCSDDFWKLIAERRRQTTISRAELEQRMRWRSLTPTNRRTNHSTGADDLLGSWRIARAGRPSTPPGQFKRLLTRTDKL